MGLTSVLASTTVALDEGRVMWINSDARRRSPACRLAARALPSLGASASATDGRSHVALG